MAFTSKSADAVAPTVHLGTLKHVIDVLGFWADGVPADADLLREMLRQSRECAQDLRASLRRFERQRQKP